MHYFSCATLVACVSSLRNAPSQLSVRCPRCLNWRAIAGDDGRLSAISFSLRKSDRFFWGEGRSLWEIGNAIARDDGRLRCDRFLFDLQECDRT